MVLPRWDPFNELRRIEGRINHVWRGFGRGYVGEESSDEAWTIPLDVIKEGDNVVVQASVPGVNPDDVEVTIDDDLLTIKGHTKIDHEEQKGNYLIRERRSGSFTRSLRLPDTLDKDNAKPYYENGVVSISFPKLEAKKAKQLKVEVGSTGKAI